MNRHIRKAPRKTAPSLVRKRNVGHGRLHNSRESENLEAHVREISTTFEMYVKERELSFFSTEYLKLRCFVIWRRRLKRLMAEKSADVWPRGSWDFDEDSNSTNVSISEAGDLKLNASDEFVIAAMNPTLVTQSSPLRESHLVSFDVDREPSTDSIDSKLETSSLLSPGIHKRSIPASVVNGLWPVVNDRSDGKVQDADSESTCDSQFSSLTSDSLSSDKRRNRISELQRRSRKFLFKVREPPLFKYSDDDFSRSSCSETEVTDESTNSREKLVDSERETEANPFDSLESTSSREEARIKQSRGTQAFNSDHDSKGGDRADQERRKSQFSQTDASALHMALLSTDSYSSSSEINDDFPITDSEMPPSEPTLLEEDDISTDSSAAVEYILQPPRRRGHAQ